MHAIYARVLTDEQARTGIPSRTKSPNAAKSFLVWVCQISKNT